MPATPRSRWFSPATWSADVRRFARDTRGVIALKFALLVPGVAMLTLGGVDLYSVYSTKSRMQEIADAAALAGARELGLAVDGSGPEGRAQAYIDGHLAEWPDAPTVESDIQVVRMPDDSRALRVRLDGNRLSFFGNMLPPGGWNMATEALAISIAATPLCVLTHGSDRDKILNIKDQAQIRAPDCMVHSNGDIEVEGGRLSAEAVQSVRGARGVISPEAMTGAAPIADPFASMDLSGGPLVRRALGCTLTTLPRTISSGRHVLPPGIHCNGITVRGTAELVLSPGEHWFLGGHLIIKEDGRLRGSDVALFFDKQSKFEFKDHALVNLDGRESGPYAGIVMAATRDNTQDFIISSDQVESLLGMIYVPNATLIVEGSADVARESAWTVIVAKYLQLKGGPQLYINADYRSSDVPVPDGVGRRDGGSRLIG